MKYLLIVLLSILFLLTGCVAQQQLQSSGFVKLYVCHLVDCNEVFIDYVSQSEDVFCALYSLHNKTLEELFIEKNARLILDESATTIVNATKRFGKGLMHHKFCVLNHSLVITGSFNPGMSSQDYNTVLVMNSSVFAGELEKVFTHLITNKNYRPHNSFVHNNFLLEYYACPQDNCKKELISLLESANNSISFALFTFTDKDIAHILLKKHHTGVLVTGVVESFQARQYNQYYVLQEAGIPVFLETSDRLQHNKLFIIDDAVVITGSYNPTAAAASVNNELLLVLHDSALASAYSLVLEDILNQTQSFK